MQMTKKELSPRLGTYLTRTTAEEAFKAFVPAMLPFKPPVDMSGLYDLLDRAMKEMADLDTLARLLPDIKLFLYMYVRKEALLSSQIEGTQSSLSDLLLFENNETPNVPVDDVEEVSNYIAALNHGLARIKKGFPLSSRLVREMHTILLKGGRGSNKSPGIFRRSQNWIGGKRPGKAMFVPPPPEMVDDLMSNLEKFIHDDEKKLPALVRAAIIHVQFETIHPFLDGNGRLGRLLITLLLWEAGLMTEPVLYLSLYFKENREQYYKHLQSVRLEGAWEEWCAFFLDGIAETSSHACTEAKKILKLIEKDRKRIGAIGRAAKSALRIHDYLLKKPFLSLTKASKELKISVPTITSVTMKLIDMGILEEMTGRARNRLFVYKNYLAILTSGTDPLS
jgi:Fic family protein